VGLGGGVRAEEGGYLRIIVAIRVQRPRTKRISYKGQFASWAGVFSR